MILLGCHLPADVYQFAPIFSFFLDSILKSRDTALPTKVHIVKDTVFPVVMYGCESWTIKKAESENRSVVSDSLQPHGLYSQWNSLGQNTGVGSRILSPGDLSNPEIEPRSPELQVDSSPAEPPGKPRNTSVDSLYLLQGILPTQELNLSFLHCRWILYQPRADSLGGMF